MYTVYLVIFLPKVSYIHRIYRVRVRVRLFPCQKHRIYIFFSGQTYACGILYDGTCVYVTALQHVFACVHLWMPAHQQLQQHCVFSQQDVYTLYKKADEHHLIVCSVSELVYTLYKKSMSTISLCVQSASFCTRCTKKSMNTVLLCVESVLVYTLYKKKSLNTVSLVVQSASLCLLVSIDFV